MLGRAGPSTWSLSTAWLSFPHSICSPCLAVSPGEDIRGDRFLFPCHCWPSLPECDMIVSRGTVQRCQAGTEVSHASAIFLRQKKGKTIELGNPGLEVLFLACKQEHCVRHCQPALRARYVQHGNVGSHPSAKQRWFNSSS